MPTKPTRPQEGRAPIGSVKRLQVLIPEMHKVPSQQGRMVVCGLWMGNERVSVTMRNLRLPDSLTQGFRTDFFVKRQIPVSTVRYEYGFGFGNLYHPYTEVLKTGSVAEGAALLGGFYDAMEMWRGGLGDWQALPVQAWRFGKTGRDMRRSERVPSAHFGLVAEEGPDQARKRVKRLFRLRDSIVDTGYEPAGQPIDGVWVGRTFLLLGGQHRVAALAHLGWDRLSVTNRGRKNTPKRLKPSRLPLVRAGQMSKDEAFDILTRVETGFSEQEARLAGFPFGPGAKA